MAAKVFISHSCKDNERAPPPGLSADAAAARAERLKFARKLREQLVDALRNDKAKRFEVFLDVRGGLNPGDVWRDGLHTALRTCSAGIVLLTPESLESGWVLKEATILSWRVFLGEPVVLVPIVLGVTQEQLAAKGFGSLDLDAIQWLTVEGTKAADVNRTVKKAVTAIGDRVAGPLSKARQLPPTERWIQEFAVHLGRAIGTTTPPLNDHYLLGMCTQLGIEPVDVDRFDRDPLINIASHALFAKEGQIIRLLQQAGKPSESQRRDLQQAVISLWVDPTPASRLLSDKARLIALDAEEVASACEYIMRAFCNNVPSDRVIVPETNTGGSDAEVLAEIKRSLAQVLPIEDADELQRDVDENGRAYVVLGTGSVRPSVLDVVVPTYRPLTFVAAAGPRPREKLGPWFSRALFLQPVLQPDREASAFRFRNRLERFVKGMSS